MNATYYLRSVAGGHHKPGAVIWGPYTLEDAHGMQRVAANPLEIVPADQLSRDDLANLVTCDKPEQDALDFTEHTA